MRLVLAVILTLFLVMSAQAVNYGDVMGEYFAQICNTKTEECTPYNIVFDTGGAWMAYCEITVVGGRYIYPCAYDVWGIKGTKLFMKLGAKEMSCTHYGQTNGIICIYDEHNIITGTRYIRSSK